MPNGAKASIILGSARGSVPSEQSGLASRPSGMTQILDLPGLRPATQAWRTVLSDSLALQGDQMLNDREPLSGQQFMPFDIEIYTRSVSDRSHHLLG